MRTRLLTLASCVAAALAVAPAASAAGAPSPPPGWPPPPVSPCPAAAECGRLEVPLDRANPAAGTTHVAYALIRHSGGGPARGTIVPNPGGPGAAVIGGVDTWRAFAGRTVLRSRDLLLIDPRGTGASDELDCGMPADALAPDRDLTRLTIACARQLGPLRANAYGSAAVADDVDAVRAHLGIDRLDLWGQSYGTYLFPVYARRHPEHVSSLLLSGAYPPASTRGRATARARCAPPSTASAHAAAAATAVPSCATSRRSPRACGGRRCTTPRRCSAERAG